jgi:hypothetical protein
MQNRRSCADDQSGGVAEFEHVHGRFLRLPRMKDVCVSGRGFGCFSKTGGLITKQGKAVIAPKAPAFCGRFSAR